MKKQARIIRSIRKVAEDTDVTIYFHDANVPGMVVLDWKGEKILAYPNGSRVRTKPTRIEYRT